MPERCRGDSGSLLSETGRHGGERDRGVRLGSPQQLEDARSLPVLSGV